MSDKRIFTNEEDKQILLCVKGELSLNEMQTRLKVSRRTLIRRILELGETFKINPTKRTGRNINEAQPEDGRDYSCTVGDDLLLQALLKNYPNRNYNGKRVG